MADPELNDSGDDVKAGDEEKAPVASRANADLNLPEDPTQTTCKQQRQLMKRIGLTPQVVGEYWYPIDVKWYDAWKRYTMWDKGDDDIDGGIDALDDPSEPRPGTIDNSALQDADNPDALSGDIQENRTHQWIHEKVWKLFSSWYTGGPAFKRKVYERGTTSYNKEKYICTFPQLVKVIEVNDNGAIEPDNAELTSVKGFPPTHTLKDIAKELEEEVTKKPSEEKEDRPFVHIWLKFGQIKAIYPIDKKGKNPLTLTLEQLKDEDDDRWVEVPDDYLKTSLEELVSATSDAADADADDAPNDDAASAEDGDDAAAATKKSASASQFVMVIEKRRVDGTWPRDPKDDWRETLRCGDIIDAEDDQAKWYESVVRCVYPEGHEKHGSCMIHFIGWNIKWDEEIEVASERLDKRHAHTKGPHRPRKKARGYTYTDNSVSFWQHENGAPEQRGVVGLRNLGNTCFMNSTIQCLAQSPALTEYFLNNDYIHHVNKDNPLGWQGRVAKAWAVLLHDMFSGKYRVVAPRQFKSAIGEVAPRFMGYAQQDSQELLSFLLDGLHEDLNQIIEKPATQAVESDGRQDAAVAQESWKTYLKRNQSKVVDLLQGQYKSKVHCPDCGRTSVTFDPYMFLSVPLPTEKYKVIEYTYVEADTSVPPKMYGQKMLKVADIGMLKDAVAKKHGVSKDELFVCDVWKSKIHRELRRHDSVGDINRKSDDIFIYHSPRPDLEEWKAQQQAEVPAGDVAGAPGDVAGARGAVAGDVDEDERRYNDFDDDDGIGGGGGYGYNRKRNKNRKENDFQTFVVNNMHRVEHRNLYGGGKRKEDEATGYPLLLTLPMKLRVTMRQIRARLWELVKPFVADESLQASDELPFVLWAQWGYQDREEMKDVDEEFVLSKRNLKFCVHWEDVTQYKCEGGDANKRARDESAPEPIAVDAISSYEENRRRNNKPIDLSECIYSFCEKETLSENDAWYCSKCKDFKCASKKIDLWSTPDLLIIHLKRFSYTRNWRDRINTLVKFPIKGLDMAPFLLSEADKKDAIYDLYAVSNHMGGMGGGHYTAYAKNLDNKQWYSLDDSRTGKVADPEGRIVGTAAYVLYYHRRNPRGVKHRASRVIVDDAALEKAKKEAAAQ